MVLVLCLNKTVKSNKNKIRTPLLTLSVQTEMATAVFILVLNWWRRLSPRRRLVASGGRLLLTSSGQMPGIPLTFPEQTALGEDRSSEAQRVRLPLRHPDHRLPLHFPFELDDGHRTHSVLLPGLSAHGSLLNLLIDFMSSPPDNKKGSTKSSGLHQCLLFPQHR